MSRGGKGRGPDDRGQVDRLLDLERRWSAIRGESILTESFEVEVEKHLGVPEFGQGGTRCQ